MNEIPTRTASLFVETKEYLRFAEFCAACCEYRYIGLCHGPPGVGKTLSALRYAGVEGLESAIRPQELSKEDLEDLGGQTSIFYTVPVVNTPGIIERGIEARRQQLHQILLEPTRREEELDMETAHAIKQELEKEWQEKLLQHDWLSGPPPKHPREKSSMEKLSRKYREKRLAIADPTSLVIIDEADHLRVASLETARAIFDKGGVGLVLIGMPGMEKRLARYPQFYSRIGFVHKFRALGAADIRALILEGWAPPGVDLPPLNDEAIAAVIRVTGGNFRLLDRLLSQAARIVRLNGLAVITPEVVSTARESLVIGQE